jgi:Na+/proline symporter
MMAGLYFKKANVLGALLAMFFGTIAWQFVVHFGGEDPLVPSIIVGLVASVFGMIVGSVIGHSMGLGIVHHDDHRAHHSSSQSSSVGEEDRGSTQHILAQR